jgi:membrane protein YdbS with pleckstrin-like domain
MLVSFAEVTKHRLKPSNRVMRFIFLFLAFLFLIGWLIGWVAFHVVAGGIHILLAIAVVLFIIHFMRGRSTAV